jgi:hypothetical protein
MAELGFVIISLNRHEKKTIIPKVVKMLLSIKERKKVDKTEFSIYTPIGNEKAIKK